MELDIIDGLKLRGIAASTFNLTDNPTHVNTMTSIKQVQTLR